MFAEFINSQSELKDFCHPAVINLAKEDIKNCTNFAKHLNTILILPILQMMQPKLYVFIEILYFIVLTE